MSEVRVYASLCGEPWCYTPDQIARLTDWQVEWLYMRPAAEKAKEYTGGAGSDLPPEPPTGQPTREQYIRDSRTMFGGSAERWGKLWDEAQARDEQARREQPG